MPTAIILAGPNGAGKTTFASQYLRRVDRPWVFLNADEIARGLSGEGLTVQERDMRAGRLLMAELDRVLAEARDFVVETTLSTKLYARRVPAWRQAGYKIGLIYIRLPDEEVSVARVKGRVLKGGHDVPELDLRRRYSRSVANLEAVYKPVVDDWEVWDSREGVFRLLQRSGG